MKGGGGSYRRYTKPLNVDGGAAINDCNIKVTTDLKRPQPGIKKVAKGDTLDVSLDSSDNIVTTNNDGDLCGYIIITAQATLIKCLKDGNEYDANVLAITATRCQIQISKR